MEISGKLDITDHVYFHGYPGSTAEAYASQYGHIFQATEGSFEDAEYAEFMEWLNEPD